MFLENTIKIESARRGIETNQSKKQEQSHSSLAPLILNSIIIYL